jgi:hypothetical protein
LTDAGWKGARQMSRKVAWVLVVVSLVLLVWTLGWMPV